MNGETVKLPETLTLRDYFAIHSPTDALDLPRDSPDGVRAYLKITSPYGDYPDNWKERVQAKARYAFADAMLAERAK